MEREMLFENQEINLCGNDNIRILGRHTEKDGCLAFDWTNSGFAFNFNGNGFIINLGNSVIDTPAFVKIIIDKKDFRRYEVVSGSKRIIVEGLSNKRHSVEVLKVTESDNPLLIRSVALFGMNAQLLRKSPRKSRRLEFIGDSITAGYGVLGRSTDPDFDTYQQDGTASYAYLTAKLCDAEARFICNSGKGVVVNCEGDRNVVKATQYYKYQTRLGGECNDGWKPDTVVINLGTNDGFGGASPEEFTEGVRNLVALERERYPEANIIWVYGVMSLIYADALKTVMRQLNAEDKKVHFLVVEDINGNPNEIGANGHPNINAAARVAALVAKKLRSINGWRGADNKDNGDEN